MAVISHLLIKKNARVNSASFLFESVTYRFLTDYLNGDIYYKTKYSEHNFDRAKNQFKLIQSFDDKMGGVI